MTTATLSFDQPDYGPKDRITFTVDVSSSMSSSTTVSGAVELPDGTELPASSVTTVHGLYGPFTVTSDVGVTYAVTQDPDDPAVWHAVPNTP